DAVAADGHRVEAERAVLAARRDGDRFPRAMRHEGDVDAGRVRIGGLLELEVAVAVEVDDADEAAAGGDREAAVLAGVLAGGEGGGGGEGDGGEEAGGAAHISSSP